MNALWAPVCRRAFDASPCCITAAGLLGSEPLVDRINAVNGSRQTSRVPLEDSVAPLVGLWCVPGCCVGVIDGSSAGVRRSDFGLVAPLAAALLTLSAPGLVLGVHSLLCFGPVAQ